MTKALTIKAGELKVGTQLAEADGFLWEITEIIKFTPKTITVRLNSDFSSYRRHWKNAQGVVKTFRKSSVLYGI